MIISENWLREWANPSLSSEDLVEQLTMAGLEVDSVSPASIPLENIVVAEVVSCEKHPDADRLNLCQVNDGSADQPVQVICGAKNVRTGLKVAFARVGAELPGIKIKKAKLRGVESFGMICSEQELQMADSSEGILELASDAPLGQSIEDYLSLNDTLIEIDLTPNRGDCLSIAGVAREVAANNEIEINTPAIKAVLATHNDTVSVELLAAESCPAYTGRIIKSVNPVAVTPLWMQEKLRRCGLRSISPVVDVTNYIMMELGQPMHGFDLGKISGGIQVRMANAGEKLELLDGSTVECRDDTLVIADHQQALALAGIMGGQSSAVTDDTVDIFLEAAFFAPALLAGKARSYGLHTDSSHRFERGVDPLLQQQAIERATQLIVEIMGGDPGPVIHQNQKQYLPQNPQVVLRHTRIERMLGISVEKPAVENMLKGLEMQYEATDEGWQVVAPSYRFDINIEADLIEEVGRLIGYNQIPGTREAAHASMNSFSEKNRSTNQLRDILVSRGYFEAITYSFVSPELQAILQPDRQTLTLANPISSDMSEMRTSLLPGLVQAMKHNLHRQQNRVRLFETGLCFIPEANGELKQIPRIAAIISGSVSAEHWQGTNQIVDFYDIKGDCESLLQGIQDTVEWRSSSDPVLHPGQSADLYIQGNVVGHAGALHPSLQKQLDLPQEVFLFELDVEILQKNAYTLI